MPILYLLFDLDGTLTDPVVGITNCVQYALEKFGIYPASREELYPYIGPPLIYSFMNFHGLSRDQADCAVVYYRERFSVKGWAENTIFEGIPELLQELQGRGVQLMVATSKPEQFTNRILEHFDLAKYFTFVAGCTLNGLRPEKADVIAYIREKYPEVTADNTLMIGDRKFDIEGAHKCGLSAVGVLYGYGDRAEMEQANADYIVEDITSLRDLLLQKVDDGKICKD